MVNNIRELGVPGSLEIKISNKTTGVLPELIFDTSINQPPFNSDTIKVLNQRQTDISPSQEENIPELFKNLTQEGKKQFGVLWELIQEGHHTKDGSQWLTTAKPLILDHLINEDGSSPNLANFLREQKISLQKAILVNSKLPKANLSDLDLSGADLRGADLRGADLSGANLTKADLSGADLSGANLTQVDLFGADFTSAQLKGTNLSKVSMQAKFTNANFAGANLTNTGLSNVNHRADFENAKFTDANLTGAYFFQAPLRGADFTGANLSGAHFDEGHDLRKVNFSGADLTGARFFRANLDSANLQGADLTGANLFCANLHGADLTGANLTGAILSHVNFDNSTKLDQKTRLNDIVLKIDPSPTAKEGLYLGSEYETNKEAIKEWFQKQKGITISFAESVTAKVG